MKRLRRYRSLPGIFRDGKVRMLSLSALLTGHLLSWWAQLFLIFSFFKHWKILNPLDSKRASQYDDTSIADHYSSKAGKELFAYAVQPVLTAIFYWFPDVVARTSEAILLFSTKVLLLGGTYKFQGGLQRIPETLAEGTVVLLNHDVTNVMRKSDRTYEVKVRMGSSETILVADGVVCATTASAVLKMFPDLTAHQCAFFKDIQYSSVSYLGRTYRNEDVKGNRNIVFPASEGLAISGIGVLHEPTIEGGDSNIASVKISAVVSMDKQKDGVVMQKKLIQDSSSANEDVFMRDSKPLSTFAWHWNEALPVMETGYFKRLKVFLEKQSLSPDPIVFAGDYLSGPCTEGAFISGMRAAEQMNKILSI